MDAQPAIEQLLGMFAIGREWSPTEIDLVTYYVRGLDVIGELEALLSQTTVDLHDPSEVPDSSGEGYVLLVLEGTGKDRVPVIKIRISQRGEDWDVRVGEGGGIEFHCNGELDTQATGEPENLVCRLIQAANDMPGDS